MPLYKQFGATPPMATIMQGLHNFQPGTTEDGKAREIVVLLDILNAPCNSYYDFPKLTPLAKINNKEVTNLADVIAHTASAWKAGFGTAGETGFIQLDFAEISGGTGEDQLSQKE